MFLIKYSNIALISFVLILITDIVNRINLFIGLSNGSTELIAMLNFIAIGCFFLLIAKFHIKDKIPKSSFFIFKMFIAYSLFSFLRGVLNAQDYWDWKVLLLTYSVAIMVPFSIVIGLNYEATIKIFRFILEKLFVFR